jgi:hypothetical protein
LAGGFGKAGVESCRIIHSQVLSAAKSKVGKCAELNELYVDPSLRREEFCIDDDDISKEKGSRNESKCFGDSPFFAETIADLVSVVDVERACSTVVAVNVLH